MSTIVVILKASSPSVELLSRLRKVTLKPLSKIKTSLRQNEPLVVAPLEYNDHEQWAEMLRALVRIASDLGISARAFELGDDEVYDPDVHAKDGFDLKEVLSVLNEHDRVIESIKQIDDIRAPALRRG